jgi:hypothetical protein
MPASVVLTAVFGSTFMAAAALGAVGYAVATFAINFVVTAVISSIIAKRQAPSDTGGAAQIGNRVQVPPSTNNKIPVVYGSAFMKPIIVDAKISTDQQTMWYVLAFSEAMENDSIGTFSFGDIYWGDKKLAFDDTDLTKVVSWTNSDGTVETQPDGKIYAYLYRDGSDTPINTALTAYDVLADTAIAEEQRWTSAKKMSKLAFIVLRINYNQDAGITGLPEITAVVNNTLKSPGLVIKDYLTNTRYGAGLSIDKVNTTSLTALDTYSNGTIFYTPAGGGAPQSSVRYAINGPVDTTKNFLDNLVDITESCDSWVQWNEVDGQWGVIINRSYLDTDPTSENVRQINDSNIVGGIDITPIDLNSTYNSVEVQFPNTKIKDQPGYHTINLTTFPNAARSPNEPDNQLTVALPYTNNVVQAQYIAARRLLQSREDLVINFTMDYSGIQIDSGDVIGIHHNRYGWGSYNQIVSQPYGKLFRVVQVQEGKDSDGSLYARLTAAEYNDGVYDDDSIELADFTPELNTGISDPSIVNTPDAPTITNVVENSDIPSFIVNAEIPTVGAVASLEFWYSSTSALGNDYIRYTTQSSVSNPLFVNGSTVSVTVTGLKSGTYFWRVRAIGLRRKSDFSDPVSVAWNPTFVSNVVGNNFTVSFSPSFLTVPRTGTNLTPNLTDIKPTAFGQANGALVPFVLAENDTDPLFTTGTWRIGSSAITGVNSGTIVKTNLTFVNANITTGTNLGANFPQISSITGSPAYIFMPVRYKDVNGDINQGAPASIQLSYIDPGAQGQSGLNGNTITYPKVWFLAPITASNATVTGGVYNRGTQTWATRPTTQYLPSGSSTPVSVNNYDYAIAVTTGNYRYNALADQNISASSTGTFTSTWSVSPQIEAGFGPKGVDGTSPQSIDFTFAGGTSFYRNTATIISPTNLTFTVIQSNINTPTALWTVSGATYTTTSTSFAQDTITITPASNATQVIATVTVGALVKRIIFPVVDAGVPGINGTDGVDGIDGIDGTDGTNGTDGADGPRGFVPLAYIPITVNPNTATQSQLSAAWLTATGSNPITNDGGSFYFGTASKSFSYNSLGVWIAATLKVAGDLIADGTIRSNALAANEIFTNKLSSTNSTGTNFGSNSSPGYWLNGTDGTAHFGGNVHMGQNLTVEGLIASSELSANVVYTNNVVINQITNGQVVFVEKSKTVSPNTFAEYNADGSMAWPANTRVLAIPGGAAIVPAVGPENGGRIIIQLSSTVYQGGSNPEKNLLELWRAGSSIDFAQEVNGSAIPNHASTNKYSYAVGTDGYNYISNNSVNWGNGFAAMPSTVTFNSIEEVRSNSSTYQYFAAVGNNGAYYYLDVTAGAAHNYTRTPQRLFLTDLNGVTPRSYSATQNLYKIRNKAINGMSSELDKFVVGSNGLIAVYSADFDTGYVEETNTIADLRDIAFSTPVSTTSGNYRAIAVGDVGTIVFCDRAVRFTNTSYSPSEFTWNINATVPVTTNLKGIATDFAGNWIAVGDYGVILRSTDNGTNWALISSITWESGATDPFSRTLTSVAYNGSSWVAVGYGGSILTSANGTSWLVQNPANDRNLREVRWNAVNSRWTITGDAEVVSSTDSNTWTMVYDGGRTQVFTYKRLWYVGSNDDPLSTATPPVSNQIGSRASLSMIINDTNYIADQVYVYYLVTGNLAGTGPITVTNPFLLVTEFKR